MNKNIQSTDYKNYNVYSEIFYIFYFLSSLIILYIDSHYRKKYDVYCDMYIIFFFFIWLKIVYNCYKAIVIIHYNNKFLNLIKGNNEKEVIIVRGVPGVGKDSYVYNKEKNTNNIFTIISNDQFFTKNDTYTFSNQDITRSDSDCLNKYLNNLVLGVNKIYITNVNNKRWMYENYIKLANINNYKVSIIELYCNDYDELKFFNKRSLHNVPLKYSKNVFKTWQKDINSKCIQPYFGSFDQILQGDSLPYPIKTKKQLDLELIEYFDKSDVNKDIDSHNDSYNDIYITKFDDYIDLISVDEINEIDKRNLSMICFKKTVFLKLDLETKIVKI